MQELGFPRAIVEYPVSKYRGQRGLVDVNYDLDVVRVIALPCISGRLDLELQVCLLTGEAQNQQTLLLGRSSLGVTIFQVLLGRLLINFVAAEKTSPTVVKIRL
jgi:hypothetical protein